MGPEGAGTGPELAEGGAGRRKALAAVWQRPASPPSDPSAVVGWLGTLGGSAGGVAGMFCLSGTGRCRVCCCC